MITDEYIKNFFFTESGIFNFHKLKKITPEIEEYLNKRYNDSESIKESIYRIKYNIEEKPKCPVCGKFLRFIGPSKLYLDHCSTRCSSLDKKVKDKLKQTKLERYGDENFSNREKFKQTCIEKYGVECYTNREKSEQTKLERYGNKGYNNIEKCHKTKLEKYGDPYYCNVERGKETCLKKYGLTNGGWTKEAQEKIHNTWMKKYGCENPMQCEIVKQKSKETCLKKYGTEYSFQSENNKNKFKITCKEKYGVEHHMQSEEIKAKFNWKEINEKRIETKRKRNSFHISKPEEECYKLIFNKYPDVIRQYKSDQYPFNCDFYIPSINTYVEYQGSYFHHFHPFDENNIEDINELNKLKTLEKEKLEKNGKTLYTNVILTWTISDVKKRKIANENNINLMEIWKIDELKSWLDNK